jgi:glycosyltransferase involved in cell wall biosynthesis
MSDYEKQNPLRILHIILAVRPTNGQYNEHCLPLMNERRISICTYFKTEISPPPAIRLFDGDGSVGGFFRAFRAALEAGEYDIIHVHTPHAGVLLLAALFRGGLYRKLRPSIVHTIQNSYQNFSLRHKLMFVPSFPFFERLVFCGQASRESFPSFLKWLGGNRIEVVQNAVDLERIDRVIQSAPNSNENGFQIVTVGMIKIKDPATVFEAFRQSYDHASHLMFLGEGALRPSLAGQIEQAGLQDRVTLAGMVERDSVFEHFSQADLFVSASWGEGLPVAVLEAMACGCPVVLSDIPPHREIAEKVDFIPLIQPGNVAGFAREIRKFKEMTSGQRADIGRMCRAIVERRFSLQAMHTGYKKIYSQLISPDTDISLRSLESQVKSANDAV